ncbi:pilus assembly PilX family protein [Hahella ganghwensis]|uniref:pilus assembly PilX family protein n=1 Tax=Hahella ganghwensis TaxID=286420 RepID=UPI000369993F|nr:PilX N-terminal domain-containing pilus assembly protein [Hahella ganghwensis]
MLFNQTSKERGSALIISLIFLVLLTIVGLSASNMSNMEERMTANFRDHELAFQAAEAALVEAEKWVGSNGTSFALTDMYTTSASNSTSTCSTTTSANCFTQNCDGGLCFTGTFPASGTPISDCTVGSDNPWEDWALWDDANKVKTVGTDIDTAFIQAKYIVEFRCFFPLDPSNAEPDPNNYNEWAPGFRITVLASGSTADSKIMLQSIYKRDQL